MQTRRGANSQSRLQKSVEQVQLFEQLWCQKLLSYAHSDAFCTWGRAKAKRRGAQERHISVVY